MEAGNSGRLPELPAPTSICVAGEGGGMEQTVIAVKMPALPGKGPNIVASVLVEPGDVVAKGQELFNVETSKRAVPIFAPASGTIARVLVTQGDEPNAQDVLAEIEEAEPGDAGAESADHEGESDNAGAKSAGHEAESGGVGIGSGGAGAKLGGAAVEMDDAEDGLDSAGTESAGIAVKPADDVTGPTGAVIEAESESANGSKPALERFEVSDCTPQRNDGEGGEDANGDDHAELLVIGAGTGGYVAALYAAKHGLRVTLVERDTLGGTCLNKGCIPTKALIASASLYRDILHAAEWGLRIDGEVSPDMRSIIERKDRVVSGLVNGIEYLMDANGIRVVRGTARFDGSDAVIVSLDGNGAASVSSGDGNGGTASASPGGNGTASASPGGNGDAADASLNGNLRLTFDNCIIATGSTIRELDLPGCDLHEVMNTDEALACTTLPSSIVIVGGGVTGMEFAFMYANLGVDVTVIARRPRVLHMFDKDASSAIARSAADHGIHIELESNVKRFERTADGLVRTVYATDGELHEVTGERVLVAGGRIPATRDLGLEAAGIALDARTGAVAVDGRMHTNVERIYAVGDVNGLVMLAHAASYQGRIAVDDILGREAAFDGAIIPSVAYTDPEVATVGIGADEARASKTLAGEECAGESLADESRVNKGRAGEAPTDEVRTAESRTGEALTGEEHVDESRVNKERAGEVLTSEVPTDESRAGERLTDKSRKSEAPTDERRAGEAPTSEARYTVGSFSFAHNGKALADGDAAGYATLVCDANDLLKGATIVGGHASALINSIGMAISAGLTGEDVRRAVFAHPTTAEAIHEAACDLSFGALHE